MLEVHPSSKKSYSDGNEILGRTFGRAVGKRVLQTPKIGDAQRIWERRERRMRVGSPSTRIHHIDSDGHNEQMLGPFLEDEENSNIHDHEDGNSQKDHSKKELVK